VPKLGDPPCYTSGSHDNELTTMIDEDDIDDDDSNISTTKIDDEDDLRSTTKTMKTS
jgi:hypothetical protein